MCQICSKIGQNAADIWRFFNFTKWRPPPSWIFFKFQILNGRSAEEAERRRRAKFGRNRSKRGRDMAIFRFFKMAASAILDFSNFKFLTVGRLNGRTASLCQICSKIGQNAAEIWRFFNFTRWRPPPSWIFFKFQIFNGRSAEEAEPVSYTHLTLPTIYSV